MELNSESIVETQNQVVTEITEPPVEIILESQNDNVSTDQSVSQTTEQAVTQKQSILQEVLEDDTVFEYNDEDVQQIEDDEDFEGENYKYTKVDKLDEDDPIPGQMFVLMSFISPERIMNCDIRGVKIRGVYASREKAEKALEILKKKDKYFDIWLGEVGKWLPWNPNTNQAEEVKYRNKKLDKIMGKVHTTEMQTLNELVGRRKDQLDKDKVAHKERIKNSVKEAVRNYDGTENSDNFNESKEIPKETKPKPKSSQRDAEAIKQRLRQKLEKRASLTEQKSDATNQTNTLDQEKVGELKTTSNEIKGKLEKMKEYMKNRK